MCPSHVTLVPKHHLYRVLLEQKFSSCSLSTLMGDVTILGMHAKLYSFNSQFIISRHQTNIQMIDRLGERGKKSQILK